jgi:hypothetical protein
MKTVKYLVKVIAIMGLIVLLGSFCRSFEAVCLKLHNALESLKELVRVNENGFPSKDSLVRLLFTAIGAVNSVRHLKNIFSTQFHSLRSIYRYIHFGKAVLFNVNL